MDVFLDSCDGKSMLGCLEDDCPAGFELDIFEIELRAHKDVFETYESRVLKTTDTFTNENLMMELTKFSLTFDICIILTAISTDDSPDEMTEYHTTLELKMTETITTQIEVEVEVIEPQEGGEEDQTTTDNGTTGNNGSGEDENENEGSSIDTDNNSNSGSTEP